MAKNTLADFDTTASNNTDVLNQSTQGSAAVSTLDTIVQNLMGVLARFYTDLGGEGTVGGTGNAITLASASTYQALEDGLVVGLKASASNSGATTLNVDGLGAKAVRSNGDAALVGGEIQSGGVYLFRYESSYNSSAGAWVLLNPSINAASSSSAGIVELATPAEAATGTDATRAVTPSGLYFPTGHLYGLTLSNNGTDAANDIDIAAGTARDASDTYNYVLPSTYVKQTDTAWALGSAAGSLDTGSVANTRYAIWGIGRSDTKVCDVLTSTSFSSPTMPTNYDFKVLLGEFTRAGGVNGPPLWYGPRQTSGLYDGINLGSPTASTSGTAIDYTSIPVGAKEVWVSLAGVSLNADTSFLVQLGTSGGLVTSGYTSSTNVNVSTAQTSTAGFVSYADNATVYQATFCFRLLNPATGRWHCFSSFVSNAGTQMGTSGGEVVLSGVLSQLRIRSVNGTATFDLGNVNISYQ